MAFDFENIRQGRFAGAGFSLLTRPLLCLAAYGDILPAVGFHFEPDLACSGCKQSMVGSHANVAAGVELGAALANQDVSGQDVFAPKFLDAEPPSLGIAAVAGGTTGLLMRHDVYSETALNYAPSSTLLIRTTVRSCRCPRFRLEFFRRLFLKA